MTELEEKKKNSREKQARWFQKNRERKLQENRERYWAKVSLGLCTVCGQPTDNEARVCPSCREKKKTRSNS